MRLGRLLLTTALAGALVMVSPLGPDGLSGTEALAAGSKAAGTASAKKSTAKKSTAKKSAAKKSAAKKSAKKSAAKKTASRKAAGKKKRGKGVFRGHSVSADSLRTEPVPKPSGDLWIYAVNFREELRVNIYNGDGSFDEAVLAELDRVFRCKRTGEQRAVDPRIFETLSVIADHFGQKRIDVVSGFRFQENEGSRHYHASAVDFKIDGISGREVVRFAETLDPGGMGIGIYPKSGFVHVDYRAPGEPSYRWTDRSPPDSGSKGKRPSRKARSTRPSS
jgi:uncharacterized protein YcbK (DUF882 family)